MTNSNPWPAEGAVGIGIANPNSGQLQVETPANRADANHGVSLTVPGKTSAALYLKVSGENDQGTLHLTRNSDDTRGISIDPNGAVGIGSLTPHATLKIDSVKNTFEALQNPANYNLWINRRSNDTDSGTGIAFGNTNGSNEVGAAIIYNRTGDAQKGELRFYTKQNTENGGRPTLAMKLKNNGTIDINDCASEAQFNINSEKNSLQDNNATAQVSPQNYHLFLKGSSGNNNTGVGIAFANGDAVNQVGSAIIYEKTGDNQKGRLHFYTKTDADNPGTANKSMTLDDNGNLAISGNLLIKDWSISVPDYVFDKNYSLMGMDQLESYIKAHRHLPGIPSEEEIKSKGVNLGELCMSLLKKIEEQVLYSLIQEHRLKNIEDKLEILQSSFNKYKK